MTAIVSAERPQPGPVPPLQNGDRLTRAEFERRYDAMPGLKKAELLEGVVYMPSPVRVDWHGEPDIDLLTVLGTYRAMTPGVRGGSNTTVRMDLDNEPQPDGILFVAPELGGNARIEGGYVTGGPELAVEIAASSASYDVNVKQQVYRRNGVREYLVWRVLDRAIDWFVWRQGQYERLPADATGVYRSEVFPGLWLDAAALLAGDLPKVHDVLRLGLASSEHAAFVAQLQAAASKIGRVEA